MASRGGPRASGTDGSDFRHRQRVAPHYKRIVEAKWNLRLAMAIHLGLISCVVLHIIMAKTLDEIAIWEWTWLVSCLACLIGFNALKQNNGKLMQMFMVGVVLFGVLSISVGLFEMAIMRPVQMVQLFLLMFGLSAGFIHVLEIMAGKVLLETWSSKGGKDS
jgi:predicted neutral ceramidase superfamily lipid hydrolase